MNYQDAITGYAPDSIVDDLVPANARAPISRLTEARMQAIDTLRRSGIVNPWDVVVSAYMAPSMDSESLEDGMIANLRLAVRRAVNRPW